MIQKVATQVELNVPHLKVWEALKDPNLLAKALPRFVRRVEVVKGDGYSTGSIRRIHFGPAVPHATYLNERIESVDEELHTISASMFEGGSIGKDFSYTKTTIKCRPTISDVDAGCRTIVEWEFECDTIVEEPPLQKAREGAMRTFKAIEAYLISSLPPCSSPK